jgi:hypothetical protein
LICHFREAIWMVFLLMISYVIKVTLLVNLQCSRLIILPITIFFSPNNILCMIKMVWDNNQMPIYLCAWHVLKAWHSHSMQKIKGNGVWHAILDNLHTVMYMVIESFTQHLPNDSWTWYFWTYYFQLNVWFSFQSIIVVPPCCANSKISILWIKVETPMIQIITCGYCVFCYRLWMVALWQPGCISIHWILLWDIEPLVLFEDERALRLENWLVSVETHSNGYKTLHEHGWNEKTHVYKKTRLWNT